MGVIEAAFLLYMGLNLELSDSKERKLSPMNVITHS